MAPEAAATKEPMTQRTPLVDWAELLKRTFDFDVFSCPRCGCFAALSTVERPLMEIQLIDKFGDAETDADRRADMVQEAGRWLSGLERRLDGRDWIACADFTVADILMATVLREIRKTDLLDPYPRVRAYYDRALARPAWARTLEAYAERLGVDVAESA